MLPPFTQIECISAKDMVRRIDFARVMIAKDFQPTDADYEKWSNRYINCFMGLSPMFAKALSDKPKELRLRIIEAMIKMGAPFDEGQGG